VTGTDLLRLGLIGLRTRRMRSALSAIGIAIGIAAVVSVLGIAASSQAALLDQIDRLGTNLLTVEPGQEVGTAGEVPLPPTAPAMLRAIDGVTALTATAELGSVHAYRTDRVPLALSGTLSVRVTDTDLPATLGLRLTSGAFLDAATAGLPVAILGAQAARHLGPASRIWLTGHWFTIGGILASQPLVAGIDRAVFIGSPIAHSFYGYAGHPSLIYVRTDIARVDEVAAKLARTANPVNAYAVRASRPSDALTARLAVARSGDGLFLGLGVVALLVAAIGIANVMVIAVLERRTEIGLRRALGATRRHIAVQFLVESFLLACIGGVGGLAAGTATVAAVAGVRGWAMTIPVSTILGGLAAAVGIGVVAGLYPAARAARLSPTEALRT
jgi:putative ABC transport system permease protein